MRTHWLMMASVLALVWVSVSVPLVAADDRKTDDARLQGVWSVVTAEKGGAKAPDDVFGQARLSFQKDAFTWALAPHEMKGTFAVDPSKTPRQIDLKSEGMMLSGIYELDGDSLKLCVAHGGERPTEFATRAGEQNLLMVLKREKP